MHYIKTSLSQWHMENCTPELTIIAFSRLMLCTLLVSCDNCSIIYCVSVCIETNLLPYTNLLLYTLGSLYNTLQFLQCTLIFNGILSNWGGGGGD